MAYEEILTTNSSIQLKRATKDTANSSTTVLKEGELCFTYNGSKPYDVNIRMGDGTSELKSLKDVVPGAATTSTAGLMSSSDKTKLDGIAIGANKTTVDSALSSTSTNPVQNKVINTALAGKANSSHTHSYLPLTGGTMTGTITTKGIKLTSGTDYGSTLPSSPATNHLFFQTVGSNFVLDNVYPVGAVYMSMNSTNPGTLFGGTWEQVQGKFLLGVSSSYPAGSSGGEATHTLTVDEMPKHDGHVASGVLDPDGVPYGSGNFNGFLNSSLLTSYGTQGRGWAVFNGNEAHPACQYVGRDNPHNNMPPYMAVYMWYRTA